MAARTAAMNLNSDLTSGRWHLVRKTFLLFLSVVALALGLAILYRHRGGFPLMLFNLLADTSLGLIAGFGARIVLSQRHWFIRVSASTAMAVIGLVVLGYCTNWMSGIGPLHAGLVEVHWLDSLHIPLRLPLQFKQGQTDWLDLAYLVIATDTSWIALRAWKPRAAGAVEQSARPARSIRGQKQPRISQEVSQPVSVTPGPRTSSSSPLVRPKIKNRKFGRPMISKPAASVQQAGSRHWGLRRKPRIQLAVYEEHRCPYCLEPVKRNDPRGSVECEVCHALHHKDCWDITGACQVPHLNT